MKTWGGEAALHYEELCYNSQLDALNVLYVALTRPVQRLYIISKMELDRKGKENDNKFSGLFISYLKQLGKWTGADEYHFGDIAELPEEEVDDHLTIEQQVFHSSPTEANGISIVTRSGVMWDSKQEAAIEKGRLVHELFAGIHSEGDVDRVLKNGREEGLFKDREESEIKKIIQEVVEHPELKQYFSEKAISYTERDIISASGEIFRPDRLNFNGNKVSVIDYKTGNEDEKHRVQITGYASVLEDMGYKVEKKLLIYLNESASITVV
jgi:ATP-dependent exoDNAse (exonuclease V) beta subunit